MYKFELEKGSKKYLCPNCSRKTFVPYVSRATGDLLSSDVGRCDRENKCGYHRHWKAYFADNPQFSKAGVFIGTKQKFGISSSFLPYKNSSQAKDQTRTLPNKPDLISKDVLLGTLKNYEQNAFIQFLLNLFSGCAEEVLQGVKDYLIGTTKNGSTIFWQIDRNRNIRTGKIIAYGTNGKRRKDAKPDWIHAALKRTGFLKTDFVLKQCFFGEHLLFGNQKPVAIVEAEKTAVIASICFPEFVWLAAGSKQSLKPERLKTLGKRKIVLYPDADGFESWQKTALAAQLIGYTVKASNLIESLATDAEKREGFDLADYLIEEQERINRYNSFVDEYNSKLEKVLNDDLLMEDFNTILDEQIAIAVCNGSTEEEAMQFLYQPENIRRIVLSV